MAVAGDFIPDPLPGVVSLLFTGLVRGAGLALQLTPAS